MNFISLTLFFREAVMGGSTTLLRFDYWPGTLMTVRQFQGTKKRKDHETNYKKESQAYQTLTMKAVLLHRIDLNLNEKRFYWIQVGPSLIEPYAVLRVWGRLGEQQRSRVTPCASPAEAQLVAQRLVQKRLKRGYQVVLTDEG